MTWDKGWNCRSTTGFVTDGTNETYAIDSDTYPTTRNGVTFGWVGSPKFGGADRNAATDRRLAGVYADYQDHGNYFRVDLPATGSYMVTMAYGDFSFSQSNQRWKIQDTTTVLSTHSDGSSPSAPFWFDASGVLRTSVALWQANNVTELDVFATTQFRMLFGDGSDTNTGCLAHLFLSQVVAAPAAIVPTSWQGIFRRTG